MLRVRLRSPRLNVAAGLSALLFSAALVIVPAAHAEGPALPRNPGTAVAALPAAPLAVTDLHPGGTQFDAVISSTEPTTISFSVSAVPAVGVTGTGTVSPVRAAFGQVAATSLLNNGDLQPPASYATTHPLHVTGLTPNTTYDLNVTAMTQAGQQLSAQARFTTLKQRIRVTLETIDIHDDGDTFGDGEPTWFWQIGWATGSVKDCFPEADGHCQEGSYSEGIVFPRTPAGAPVSFIFAQENFQPIPNPHPQPGDEDFTTMPTQLSFTVSAKESDDFILGSLDSFFDWGAWISGNPNATYQVPQGVESARDRISVSAEDGSFRSTMYFRIETFYDAQSYPPNDGRVFATSQQ